MTRGPAECLGPEASLLGACRPVAARGRLTRPGAVLGLRRAAGYPAYVHRYLVTIAYDGTTFAGWQRQRGADTVQERIEGVLHRIFGEHVAVHGAGRTDAGVHAIRQCAHVDLPRAVDPGKLRYSLDSMLPTSIGIRELRAVASTFHARFSAVGKRYVYRCHVGRRRPVHARDFVHWVKVPLDLGPMRTAARHLVGEHDFASFATNPGYERSRGTVRRIDHLHLIHRARGFDLFVQGNGFLYNMVRTIAGTLIDVGRGRRSAREVAEVLAARDRNRAGMNAPARGLYLQRVLYPPGATHPPDAPV